MNINRSFGIRFQRMKELGNGPLFKFYILRHYSLSVINTFLYNIGKNCGIKFQRIKEINNGPNSVLEFQFFDHYSPAAINIAVARI